MEIVVGIVGRKVRPWHGLIGGKWRVWGDGAVVLDIDDVDAFAPSAAPYQ